MLAHRPANISDRRCDKCRYPMAGIMEVSDKDGYTAPRKVCCECEPTPKLKGKKNGK